jgi:hypothetical protein
MDATQTPNVTAELRKRGFSEADIAKLWGGNLLRVWQAAIDAATAQWTPDLVMISAGFDSLAGDPLGGFTLEIEDMERLTRELVSRAVQWCGGRLVSALEGGYAPDRIGEACVAHIGAHRSPRRSRPPRPSPRAIRTCRAASSCRARGSRASTSPSGSWRRRPPPATERASCGWTWT